jgi:hypothetical protein
MSEAGRTVWDVTVRIEQTDDEQIIHGDADNLLHVTSRVRLLGHAYQGVHVHRGGTLITSGIIAGWLQVDTDAACYTSGLIRAQPQVAEGGLLDIRGWLTIPRLRREQPGTILLAVGARYNDLILQPGGTLTPLGGIEGGNAPEHAPRYHIVSGGRVPALTATSAVPEVP